MPSDEARVFQFIILPSGESLVYEDLLQVQILQ